MICSANTSLNYWNLFLALEADVVKLSRYIEFTEDNYKSYSVELARIVLSASSEIDVICKLICTKNNNNSKADSIGDYRTEIMLSDPSVAKTHVIIPRFGLSFQPWKQWLEEKNPAWWQAYNNIKHHRHVHFADANLKNALSAAAGLFVLLLFYYKTDTHKGSLRPGPILFRAGKPFNTGWNLYEPHVQIYELMK